jgi:hypothetical protein
MDAEIRAKLNNTVFIVEANSYEAFALWRENSEDSSSALIHKPVQWRQENPGFLITLGELDNMPVTLSLNWVTINGSLVLFYYMPSVVTDSRMADKWLEENCNPPKWDNCTRRSHCDAMNFHHCLDAIGAYQELAA